MHLCLEAVYFSTSGHGVLSVILRALLFGIRYFLSYWGFAVFSPRDIFYASHAPSSLLVLVFLYAFLFVSGPSIILFFFCVDLMPPGPLGVT